ncbi:MAG: MATE family efflux transporter [Oscillospiraceae bacterium]|nr:MATE family efflux transporter [Oscillospiraceae bacterium]
MSKRTIDMTVGSPAKHILRFAIPLILTNVGQQLYMIADAAIVGRGVGVKAFAAVGATDWSYWMILWTVGGLTQGFSTFVARAFGEKNHREMNRLIATSVVLCVLIGGSLTVLGLSAARPLLRLLHTPADILPGATAYLMTMVGGTLAVMGYNMAAAILRALGDGRTPLNAMIIAALLNIALDCLFVFVLNWGIVGAAAASVLAQLVSFLYCSASILKIDMVKLDREAWKPDPDKIKSMLLFGLPIALQYVVITLGGMILQSSVNLQGSIFIAGYTATNKLYSFLQCFAMSFGVAACTFIAQNYGAGRFDRVRRGVVDSVKIVTITAVIMTTISLVTRWQILRVFLDVEEAGGMEALAVAVRYLTIMSLFFVIQHILHVFRNVLQALGVAVWFMASGVAEFVARLFLSKVAIHHMGTDALFIAEPASWLGAMLCVFLPYFYYKKKLLTK